MTIPLSVVLAALAGVGLGVLLGWWMGRASTAEARARLDATLQAERESFQERLATYRDAEQRLKDAFSALSADTLDANARRFLDLATARLEALTRRRATGSWPSVSRAFRRRSSR